jgi:hypothetical protein
MKTTVVKIKFKSVSKRFRVFKYNIRFSCCNFMKPALLHFITFMKIDTVSTITQIITNVLNNVLFKITHREKQQPGDYIYSSHRLKSAICFMTKLLNVYIIVNRKYTQVCKHISWDLVVDFTVEVQCRYWNTAECWNPLCSLFINQYFDWQTKFATSCRLAHFINWVSSNGHPPTHTHARTHSRTETMEKNICHVI